MESSVVDIEEIVSDDAPSASPKRQPKKVRISSTPSTSTHSTCKTPTPRKTRTRHRQVIYLDEEQCQKLLENLMSNRDLQGKALQIQEFKAQLAHLAGQRIKEENLNISESFSSGHEHFESGDFSGSPIIVEPDDADAEDLLRDIRRGSVSLGNMADPNGLSVHHGTYSMEMVPELNRSFAQSVVEFVIGSNKEEIIERAQSGSHVVRELALGNVAGYFAACFLRKFGKTVICSAVGGALLVKLAHSRGYISVDWDRVYDMIQGPMLEGNHEEIHGLVEDLENAADESMNQSQMDSGKKSRVQKWITNKLANVGIWAKDNTYLAAGFAIGFMFKSMTSQS